MTAVMDDSTAPAVVRREERVYEEWKRDSFFHDLARYELTGDSAARARLDQNRREHDVERRTNPTTATGAGGEFAPPLWVIQQWKAQARAGRVLGDLAQNLLLPSGVSSIHIPKTTTGADVNIQPGQSGVDASTDQVTSDVGSNSDVVTISGHVDASMQLFEQAPMPGYDGIVYKDLTLAYNQRLEFQMLAGTGSAGQLTGVTNVANIINISGAGVSQTQDTMVQNLWPLIGRAAASVGNNRLIPADVIIMAPRRYYAIVSAKDGSSRILGNVGLVPTATQIPPAGNAPPVDRFIGISTYVSGGIIGTTATNADYIVVARVGDMLLYESADHWTVNPNPLSGTMQIRMQLHKYVCFINTQSQSIAVVTSIPQPTNF